MGRRVDAVFMNKPILESEHKHICSMLGLTDSSLLKTTTNRGDLERFFEPTGIFIGSTDSWSIIAGSGNIMGFNYPQSDFIEDYFKENNVLFVANSETSNGYFYHLIEAGKTTRKKSGASPDLYEDIGDELEEEKAYYLYKAMKDGQEMYYCRSLYNPNDIWEYTHDQVGGDIALKLVKRITGSYYDDLPPITLYHYVGNYTKQPLRREHVEEIIELHNRIYGEVRLNLDDYKHLFEQEDLEKPTTYTKKKWWQFWE